MLFVLIAETSRNVTAPRELTSSVLSVYHAAMENTVYHFLKNCMLLGSAGYRTKNTNGVGIHWWGYWSYNSFEDHAPVD